MLFHSFCCLWNSQKWPGYKNFERGHLNNWDTSVNVYVPRSFLEMQAWTGIRILTSAMPVHRFTSELSIRQTGNWLLRGSTIAFNKQRRIRAHSVELAVLIRELRVFHHIGRIPCLCYLWIRQKNVIFVCATKSHRGLFILAPNSHTIFYYNAY